MMRALHILGVTALFSVLLFAIEGIAPPPAEISYVRPEQPQVATTSAPAPAKQTATTTVAKKAPKKAAQNQQNTAQNNDIYRIDHPYDSPAIDTETLNRQTRSALVNILCETSGSLHPISGSGVMIDPRGVILTNAHVAQYVLLATDLQLGLSCSIRTGSPAQAKWRATVLYMPKTWVAEHAADIVKQRPMGTGEYDYALLIITGALDGSPLPQFPFLSPDTRDGIGFTGDSVLLASYPAEFAGGIAAQTNLYASSAYAHIGELYTFDVHQVDVLSLGGVILAQGGSSGGAVVNAWGRLIGLITTTSDGASTSLRDLRAITLSYIDRDLKTTTGSSLVSSIAYNPQSRAAEFMENTAPLLVATIEAYLPH